MGLSMLIFRGSKVQGLESYFLVCPSFHAFIDLRTVPGSWDRPLDLSGCFQGFGIFVHV